jgi:transposase
LICGQLEKVHLFVFTLGYSRRLNAHGYQQERLTTLLNGRERAFRWFGGVTLSCLYDTRATWCWPAASTKCCDIRSSRI